MQNHNPVEPLQMETAFMITQQEICLAAARAEATKSPHPSVKVGMVLTHAGTIIGRGHNAPPNGVAITPELLSKPKRDSFLCAERIGIDNAYRNMAAHGLNNLAGTEAYVTIVPCNECAKAFAQAGVTVVNVPVDALSKTALPNLKNHWIDSIKKGKITLKRAGIKLNYI
jgi:deoxycytidylate deaminase